MAKEVKCPNGCLLRIPDKRLADVIRCPQCKSNIKVSHPNDSGVCESPVLTATFVDSDLPVVVDVDIRQVPSNEQIAGRVERALHDRMLLARFLAIFVCIIGLINFGPAVYHWAVWYAEHRSHPLPPWIFIQILIASLMVVFSFLVWQVQDWSVLNALAVLTLILAAAYTFAVTSTMIGWNESSLVRYIRVPFDLLNTFSIWCVAMLLLNIVTSWISIKEALNWRRIESIYKTTLPSN